MTAFKLELSTNLAICTKLMWLNMVLANFIAMQKVLNENIHFKCNSGSFNDMYGAASVQK